MKDLKNTSSDGTAPPPGSLNNERTDRRDRPDEPTDQQLVTRCRAGHMDAFATLIERHQHRLFNAILRMVANYDDAQEITQDAFVRALQGLKKFRGNAAFYTWLFRIGMNLSINHRRRQQHMRFASLAVEPSDITGSQADRLANLADHTAVSPSRQAQINEDHHRVLAALQDLPPHSRAVVVLRDIEQLDYAQIAKILELPVGTVKSRISRARDSLRNQLNQ